MNVADIKSLLRVRLCAIDCVPYAYILCTVLATCATLFSFPVTCHAAVVIELIKGSARLPSPARNLILDFFVGSNLRIRDALKHNHRTK